MHSTTFRLACGLSDEPWVLDLSELFARFRALPDRRARRGRRYPLWALLGVATLAKLAGHHCPQAIADWAQLRVEPLCRLLQLWRHRMPALRSWDRVFAQGLDPDELERFVSAFFAESWVGLHPVRGRCAAAIDGKVLRGTIRVGRSPGVHLLAIYRPGEGIVVAQVEIGSKGNEISAAPSVLAQVQLRGLLVTGDAMFAQRELSVQIVEAGGDYLWQVKENQPRLLEAIETLFTPQRATPGWGKMQDDFTTASSVNKGHGRIERRTITVSSMLQGYANWPYLAQVFRLECEVLHTATGKVTDSVRYGVTSLPAEVADAAHLLALVRIHWRIESGLHYRRDVTLEEDKARVCTGHAPHVHAILNNIVLAFLHQRNPGNVARAHREAIFCIDQLLARQC